MEDPLALAREITAAYAAMGGRPAAPPPGPGKIVMEPAKEKRGGGAKKAAARSGEPWTDSERISLVKAFLKGKHIGDIAATHARTVGACQSQLKQIGFSEDDIYA